MNARGKLENVKREMERLNVNNLGMSEMRWEGAGREQEGFQRTSMT